MQRQRIGRCEAFEFVKKKRSGIFPNEGFNDQLDKWEEGLKIKATAPCQSITVRLLGGRLPGEGSSSDRIPANKRPINAESVYGSSRIGGIDTDPQPKERFNHLGCGDFPGTSHFDMIFGNHNRFENDTRTG